MIVVFTKKGKHIHREKNLEILPPINSEVRIGFINKIFLVREITLIIEEKQSFYKVELKDKAELIFGE